MPGVLHMYARSHQLHWCWSCSDPSRHVYPQLHWTFWLSFLNGDAKFVTVMPSGSTESFEESS